MPTITCDNETLDQYPLVVSLPHSGTWIPQTMAAQLLPTAVLANTDWFLPTLYDFLPGMGVTVIANQVNRYVADPNRAPTLVTGTRYTDTVVYPQNTFHHPLYRQPLSAQTIAQRLAAYHRPYHKQLAALIDHKVARFGRCVLLDLHSFAVFPSRPDEATPDIDLGNRRDTTSSAALRQAIGGTFQSSGLAVGNNACFTGGYITQHYGALAPVAAVQIELRYGAYIAHREFGEEVLTSYQSAVFDRAKMQLHQAFTEIIATVAGQA